MSPFDAAWLAAAIALAAPLLVAGMGELVLERSGMLNIGIEGMVAAGAFASFAVAYGTGSTIVALVAAALVGIALGLIMAGGVLVLGADQIVLGFGIFIVCTGGTAFVNEVVFADKGRVSVPGADRWEIPLLGDIPGVGSVLFNQTPYVYAAYLLMLAIGYLLYRTQLGLVIRAAGESPDAAQAAGHSVRLVRTGALLVAGAMAGLAGAFLSVGVVGVFNEGMTQGKGFVALAAVAFAGWRLRGLLIACIFFGGLDALQLRLQSAGHVPQIVWGALALVVAVLVVGRWRGFVRGRSTGEQRSWLRAPWVAAAIGLGATLLWLAAPQVTIPAQFYLMLPYVAAVAALAGFAGRNRQPAALGVPLPATQAAAD